MSQITQEQADWFAQVFRQVVDNVERAVVGKPDVVEVAVTCMMCQGHLLIEDVPGNGKTTLAKALAKTIMGSQARIQFTPDLTPADITGSTVFDDRMNKFRFHTGPLFNTVVLADEINRASPRTQSALLEVMEEGRVTVRGETHTVGPPFMVIATQNPSDHAGTFPLPEAQLDRFLMRATLGYLDETSTLELLADSVTRDRSSKVASLLDRQTMTSLLEIAGSVGTDAGILRVLYRIAEASRSDPTIRVGLSLRGCLGYLRAAKTWAAAHGRTSVTVDDLVTLAEPVMAHRLAIAPEAVESGWDASAAVSAVIERALATPLSV